MRSAKRAVGVVAAAIVVAAAGPAAAHEEIAPATFPTGRPAFLWLTAANERTAPVTRVALRAPDGTRLGAATRPPSGWTAQRSGQTVTWSGGRLAPASFEQWGFELDPVGQPGPLRFTVTLGYADGDSHESQVEASAVAAGAGGGPTTASAGSPATTVAPTTMPSGGTGSGDASAEDRANAALAVGVVAGLLALVALGVTVASRRRSSPSAGKAVSGEQEGQDW